MWKNQIFCMRNSYLEYMENIKFTSEWYYDFYKNQKIRV